MANFLTTTEVAAILSASPRTIKAMCRDGRIKAAKVGNRYLIDERIVSGIKVAHRGPVPKATTGKRGGRPRKSE